MDKLTDLALPAKAEKLNWHPTQGGDCLIADLGNNVAFTYPFPMHPKRPPIKPNENITLLFLFYKLRLLTALRLNQ
ncbi:hypothetical protein [Aeromonas sp. Y318-1]|uniref:hypothetical protein n=1 Tax=Aeromonas TaxID=642 RepID=UPI0022E35BE2|nr:hypothetical protein [Aeromonas sp. Y318-1]